MSHTDVYLYIRIYIAILLHTYNYIYSDTLKLRMRFRKKLHVSKKWDAAFFSPFCQSGRLSNGDLRMCGHWNRDHIIVLLSWFWLGIVKSPRLLNIKIECRHLSCVFHQQRMLFFTFYLHFGRILHENQRSTREKKTMNKTPISKEQHMNNSWFPK